MIRSERQQDKRALKHAFLSLLLFTCLAPVSPAGYAEPDPDEDVFDMVANTVTSDDYELLVPVYIWHNRARFTDEEIDQYNEIPLGIGIGKYYYDSYGNKHSLGAMVFQDSYEKLQPFIGYSYELNWRASDEGWRAGIGFNVGVTARHEEGYKPIPALLPLASIGYGDFSLQAVYVPHIEGVTRRNDMAFSWLSWQF